MAEQKLVSQKAAGVMSRLRGNSFYNLQDPTADRRFLSEATAYVEDGLGRNIPSGQIADGLVGLRNAHYGSQRATAVYVVNARQAKPLADSIKNVKGEKPTEVYNFHFKELPDGKFRVSVEASLDGAIQIKNRFQSQLIDAGFADLGKKKAEFSKVQQGLAEHQEKLSKREKALAHKEKEVKDAEALVVEKGKFIEDEKTAKDEIQFPSYIRKRLDAEAKDKKFKTKLDYLMSEDGKKRVEQIGEALKALDEYEPIIRKNLNGEYSRSGAYDEILSDAPKAAERLNQFGPLAKKMSRMTKGQKGVLRQRLKVDTEEIFNADPSKALDEAKKIRGAKLTSLKSFGGWNVEAVDYLLSMLGDQKNNANADEYKIYLGASLKRGVFGRYNFREDVPVGIAEWFRSEYQEAKDYLKAGGTEPVVQTVAKTPAPAVQPQKMRKALKGTWAKTHPAEKPVYRVDVDLGPLKAYIKRKNTFPDDVKVVTEKDGSNYVTGDKQKVDAFVKELNKPQQPNQEAETKKGKRTFTMKQEDAEKIKRRDKTFGQYVVGIKDGRVRLAVPEGEYEQFVGRYNLRSVKPAATKKREPAAVKKEVRKPIIAYVPKIKVLEAAKRDDGIFSHFKGPIDKKGRIPLEIEAGGLEAFEKRYGIQFGTAQRKVKEVSDADAQKLLERAGKVFGHLHQKLL